MAIGLVRKFACLLQRAVKDEVCELHGNPALTTRQVAHVTEDALEEVSVMILDCFFLIFTW